MHLRVTPLSLSTMLVLGLGQSAAIANDPHCEGRWGYTQPNCPDPQSDQVVVYADANAGGKCMTFSAGFVDATNAPGSPPGFIPSLSKYGLNDCISSVKVGSNVRLLAYQNDNYNVEGSAHNLSWHMSTHEPFQPPGPFFSYAAENMEPSDNDDYSSLIILKIDQTTKERIPNHYLGSDPAASANAFWKQEAQGLCHNSGFWFLTSEPDLPDGFPLGDGYHCVGDPPHWYDLKPLTGRVWKVPRSSDLSSSSAAGGVAVDLQNMPIARNTFVGYRHFGDPDCQTIGGKDYVFVPVQGCNDSWSAYPIPYVLVLSADDLSPVATWTIPTQEPQGSYYSQ